MAEFDYLDVCGGIMLRARDPARAAAYLREQIEKAFVARDWHDDVVGVSKEQYQWLSDQWTAATARAEAAEAEVARLQASIPAGARWNLGDKVRKKRGSSWRGVVCGFYSTKHTPIGYAVDSAFEPGSVQVWPEAALEDWDGAK